MPDKTVKFEKIASALYLVTSFFADLEPLKWRIRSYSADLVSPNVKDKFTIIGEIGSLMHLARNAGLVSDSNHKIISDELAKIRLNLEKPLESMFSSIDVPQEKKALITEEIVRQKDNLTERRELPKPAARELKEFGAVSVKKTSRQSVIIGLLKRKKEIMIKDVSPLIDGCSEKTIQRELLAMVASGILKKTGEKRWSRYSLAHA